MFKDGEPDESSLVPVFSRRSFVDDICFMNGTNLLNVEEHISFRRTACKQMRRRLAPPQNRRSQRPRNGSFLGALNYYSRFVQDFAVYAATLYQLKYNDYDLCDTTTESRRGTYLASLRPRKGNARNAILEEWTLSSTLLYEHDDKLYPVRFCGRVLKDAEMNYLPAEVLDLLLLLKVCYAQLVDRAIHVYTRFWKLDWDDTIRGNAISVVFSRQPSESERLRPRSTTVSRTNERRRPRRFVCGGGTTGKRSTSSTDRPGLLYARLVTSYQDREVQMLRQLLLDTTEITRMDYSDCCERFSLNLVEYLGINNGVMTALQHGAEHLIIVGDSRLAIQQSLGVISCKKDSLMTKLNCHRKLTANLNSVRYLHVVREYNAAADSLASEAPESKT
ncbi:hypothetical protein PHMEG_00031875 [Phytophthora megakarya]|uniref:RNase H type-1 domain-containing protein n=1 Tax=Phytophthora megakarya TaxID=4795 RepID=A0A225UYE4_9STRA|nr:hypothetical protein PHMEG_00031875 [Phytophthora megakarya]